MSDEFRIMQDGNGNYFIERKLFFWWVIFEGRFGNLFNTLSAAEDEIYYYKKRMEYIGRSKLKPKLIKTL